MQDKRIPYLAAGLLTQAEARELIDFLKRDFDLSVVDELLRAFRSLTVAVIEGRHSEWDLSDWAEVVRYTVAALGRPFEGTAERFNILRMMLTEAAKRAAIAVSGENDRPNMQALISTLEQAPDGMTLSELESLGGTPYSIAQRLRIAVASGTVKMAGDWKQRRFIATGRPPSRREDYPPRASKVA